MKIHTATLRLYLEVKKDYKSIISMGGRVETHVISKFTARIPEGLASLTGENRISGKVFLSVPIRYLFLYTSVNR